MVQIWMLVLSTAFALTALAENANVTARRQKQEVFVNLAEEPPSLDPTKYVDAVSYFWLGHMFEGLMMYD